MSVVISMLIGSKLSNVTLVKNSISTIIENIGTSDFLLVVGIAPYVPKKIFSAVHEISNSLNKINCGKIIIVKDYCETFAIFTNHVIKTYTTNSKWFIISHDDVELKTRNLIPTVENVLKSSKKVVGWISFTDDDYLNGNWAPSTRPGYYIDFLRENAWNKRKMFQFHNLKDNWLNNRKDLRYDFPSSPVRCHAPFSHFIMIEVKKLKKIGLCENWSEVSLLIDEDWGLSAMRIGMINIWIPNIFYTHCRGNGTRAAPIILKKGKAVADLFYKKWGFPHSLLNSGNVRILRRKFRKSNILWSLDRRSFEWEYV